MRPTEGSIVKRGRIAALLELGSGFHGDLTGRENVYMNASILGFSRKEIDRIFDDVVAFSEIEDFIDNQVKHYSSGMAARLGFAVAVNVEPEILLVDEVLSVGDEAFQRKCLERIKRFQREGRTILLVSHAVDLVRRICDRAAVLDHGELVAVGPPGEAALAFREYLQHKGVEVHFCAPEVVDDVVFSIAIHDQDGRMLLGTNTDYTGDDPGFVEGNGTCTFIFERFPVLDGIYSVDIGLHSHDVGVIYDQRAEKDTVKVVSSGRTVGLVDFPVRARIVSSSTPIAH